MATCSAPSRRTFILASLLLFVFSGIQGHAQTQKAAATEVRVGIVLGNAPAGTDEPTTAQTARCLKGYELYKNGTVNKLLVTGGFTRDHISEARMMKIALVTFGVPPADVIEDEMAATTIENGLFSARLFEQHGWQKTAQLVSQKYHLPRAGGIFQKDGFQVQDAPSADAVTGLEDFAPVPDMKGDAGVKVEPTDLLIVYERYSSTEPMNWPTAPLAHRLRIAASLFHRKSAPTVMLCNDRYTRGPVDIAQMMKIALVSLGVPAASIKVVPRSEYRGLLALAKAYGDKSATILTSSADGWKLPADAAPKWKPVFID